MYCFFLLLIAVYVYSIKFAFLAIYPAFYYFFSFKFSVLCFLSL